MLKHTQNAPRRPNILNISTLDTSKHSTGNTSSNISPAATHLKKHVPKIANGGTIIAARSPPVPPPKPATTSLGDTRSTLTSLALLCIVSLLLALLSLIFLLKISPGDSGAVPVEEFAVVYEVTLALCALTLSLNLCCLLVCAIQFLFAVKLVHSPGSVSSRSNKYLQKSAVTRVCAVGGFFISIPVFLTGIILYTFIQFHSTPAIVTSVFIGLGIVFCGCAMVHNVFVWQKEKTNVVKAIRSQEMLNTTMASAQILNASNAGFLTGNGHIPNANSTLANVSYHSTNGPFTHLSQHSINMLQHQATPYIIRPPTSTPPTAAGDTLPTATLDLSHGLTPDPHELSTLV